MLKVRDQQFRHLQGAVAPPPAPPALNGEAPESAVPPSPAPHPNAALIGELVHTMRQINAPKRVVRDAQGRVSHLEPMPPPVA